jgi:recombination protein RecA
MAKGKRQQKSPEEQFIDDLRKEIVRPGVSKDALIDPTGNEFTEVDTIPTNIIPFDYVTGVRPVPGFPRARITEVFGLPGTLKTTITLRGVANCIRNNGVVVYLDYEHALTLEYLERAGVDAKSKRFVLLQPECLEEGAHAIFRSMARGVDMIVIDSLAGMIPRKKLQANVGEGQVGIQAKCVSNLVEKLLAPLKRSATALVVLNQPRVNIGNTFEPEMTPGGRALKHYASLRIELMQTKEHKVEAVSDFGNKENATVGTYVHVIARKNKVGVPFRHTTLNHWIKTGFDNMTPVIDKAVKEKVLVQRSSHLYWHEGQNDEVHVASREKLMEYLLDNPEFFTFLGKEAGLIFDPPPFILARQRLDPEMVRKAEQADKEISEDPEGEASPDSVPK